jgi:cytochrome P450
MLIFVPMITTISTTISSASLASLAFYSVAFIMLLYLTLEACRLCGFCGLLSKSGSSSTITNAQLTVPTEQEQAEIGIKIANDWVMLQSQEVCTQILSRDIMKRHPDLGLGDLFNRWLGMCLGALDSRDPRWGKTKRIFRPLFEQNMSTDGLIADWDRTLRNTFETMKLTGETVSISEIVDHMPLRYILRLVFGKTFVSKYSDHFESLRHDAESLMFNVFNNKHAKSKYYKFLSTDVNATLTRFRRDWDSILELAAEDVDATYEGSYRKLLATYNSTNLDWEHFSQTLAEIIYANQDVAVPSMKWLMTHFSLHPMIEDDIDNYIEEVGRMSPIFPTSMPRLTTKDHVVGGITIGPGTPVVLDFVALGYSLDWEMEDLDQFRPRRFDELEDRKKFISRFGYGGRKCPGHKLANNLFRDMLRHIRENWRLIPKRSTDLSDVKLDPSKAFLSPLHDVWIVPADMHMHGSDLDGIQKIYYNCSPISDLTESAFMAVSTNVRSPYLTDESKVRNVVKYLADRSEANRETDPTVIYICDEIANFNIQAFNRHKPERAMKEAIELGDRFVQAFQECVDEIQVADRIRICRWSDDENRANHRMISYLKSVNILDERIEVIASNYLEYRGQNRLNTSYNRKLELVKEYIFHEIPVLILGILVDGVHYRLLHYSGSHTHLSKFVKDDNSLHSLINDIYTEPEFESVLNTLVSSSRVERAKVPGFVGIEF